MLIGIICIILITVFSFFGIINGIVALHEGDEAIAGLGFIVGAIGIIIGIISVIELIDMNTESTEKVIGKGAITKSSKTEYYDGGKDNTNEIIYFIVTEDDTKIIVSKSDWENIEDEYTFVEADVDIL